MMENLWHQLWGIVVLSLFAGICVVIFLLVWYLYKRYNKPKAVCPVCLGELSDKRVGADDMVSQECFNPRCEIDKIIYKSTTAK